MKPDDYERGKRTKNRIEMLDKARDLLELEALCRINRKRNEIGHELGKTATVAELMDAIRHVNAQLLAWNMIEPRGPYVSHYEVNNRPSSKPEYFFEIEHSIRIVCDDKTRAELKQIEYVSGPS